MQEWYLSPRSVFGQVEPRDELSERPEIPKRESLDDIIGHSAMVLADQIQKAAAWAKSEMDLQIEVAGALKEFARRAKITLDVHHNVTVATGRPDSVYSNVIVEYKDPGSLSGNRDAANNKKLIEQIRQRFYDMRREENRAMNSMFGVGTDGKYFVFVRFRYEKWTDQEPLEAKSRSPGRRIGPRRPSADPTEYAFAYPPGSLTMHGSFSSATVSGSTIASWVSA